MNSPTGPGPYWRKHPTGVTKILTQVAELDGILMVLIPGDSTFEDELVPADSLGCEWERLFTIEEMQKYTKPK